MLSTDANILSRARNLMTYIRHSCTVTDHDITAYMRGIAALLPAKYKFKQIRSMTGSWGTVTTSTRKKQEGNASAETVLVPNEKIDPIVAFSRPPPLPPVFGPLIALSFFEMWSSHDGDDD